MEPNNGGDVIFRDETGEPITQNHSSNNDGKPEAKALSGNNISMNGVDSMSPQPKQQQAPEIESFVAVPEVETTGDSNLLHASAPLTIQETTTRTPPPLAKDLDPTVGDENNLSIPKQLSRKDLRRKNRRRLHRLLKKPGAKPSFLRIIEEKKKTIVKQEPNAMNSREIVVVDDDDSEDGYLLEPPKVVIDVDAYLGLKKRRKFPEEILSAEMVPSHGSIPSIVTSSNGIVPTRVVSSTQDGGTSGTTSTEWFDGTCPMAMQPEDSLYLTQNQQYIRKHMEFFTATQDDIASISHRKSPMVLGRVGFRCMKCAEAVRYGITPRMPPASVSFPKNYSALYNLTIQKQQMHIDDCIFIPEREKWNKTGAKPRKRKLTTLPALEYWKIACKRLGIVELENNEGLRFARDPNLEPLSFESIQAQVKQEQSTFIPRSTPNSIATGPTTVPSSAAVNSGTTTTSSAAAMRSPTDIIQHPKAVADVLEEAKRQQEDMTIHLITKGEASVLSDFMFMTMQQATYCHAVAEDFATRGKKTRLMRIGYTGFCCRHCKLNYRQGGRLNLRVFQNSCRSFSSSRDNIGSAMSNSFVLHLQKCEYTPHNIKNAMQALKKVHSKQMSGLPYGSQSSIFEKLWQRIRASDKPKENGALSPTRPKISTSPHASVTKTKNDNDDEYLPDATHTRTNRHFPTKSRVSRQQPISLPPIDEVECRQVLKDAEENWDLSQNDHLIQKQDRGLISDFVFLCMRQLKVAIPNGSDFRLNRSRRMAGVCCRHCSGGQSTSRTVSSGRSFPSAPDNIASILNATIYKHLTNCPSVPMKLKQTIDVVRKSHTKQCASLPYGSQRRYFKKLFERLRNVPIEGVLANTINEPKPQNGINFSSAIQKCEFVRNKNSNGPEYWQCLKCRMVPYDYRAPGSIFFSTPSVGAMEEHRMVCQNDGIYWKSIQSSLKKLCTKYSGVTSVTSLVNMESFVNLVRSVVGSEEGVCDTYMAMLGNQTPPSFQRDIWRRLALRVDFKYVQESFSILRKDLCFPPRSLSDCADFVEFLQHISCNFQIPPAKFFDDKTESIASTSAPEYEKEPKVSLLVESKAVDLGTIEEFKSDNHFFHTEVPSMANDAGTTTLSGDVSHSSATKATPTLQDPQHYVKDDSAGTTTPNPMLKEEKSNVDQRLTLDQGRNVMDKTKAEQFDDVDDVHNEAEQFGDA